MWGFVIGKKELFFWKLYEIGNIKLFLSLENKDPERKIEDMKDCSFLMAGAIATIIVIIRLKIVFYLMETVYLLLILSCCLFS